MALQQNQTQMAQDIGKALFEIRGALDHLLQRVDVLEHRENHEPPKPPKPSKPHSEVVALTPTTLTSTKEQVVWMKSVALW